MILSQIRLKRLNAEIDIETAVKKLGISKSMLYKIETGNRSPSTGVIRKMSKLYKCSVDEIFKALKLNKEVKL